MNNEIELHDSVISQMHEIERRMIVEFSPAYVHRSKGKPGIDSGSGWVQDVRMSLTGATPSGNCPLLPETLSEGSLRVGGLERHNLLPVTLQTHGLVELRLVFVTGQEVVISAEAITLELTGEARYVEEFSGGNVNPSEIS